MAYAGTVTITRKGRMCFVSIAETEGASASEATIALPFLAGRVKRVSVEKTSGDAATFIPVLGTATAPAGDDIVHTCASAATPNETPNSGNGAPFYAPTGILYHRSVPNAGTNNVTTVRYLIVEGV